MDPTDPPPDPNTESLGIVDVAGECNRLQKENVRAAIDTVERAMRIGELLTLERAKHSYGTWLPWFIQNIHFSIDTYENYKRVYENRKAVRLSNIETIDAALKMIRDATREKKEPKAKSTAPSTAATTVAEDDARAELKRQATFALFQLKVPNAKNWADAAEGETVEEIIKNALRLREGTRDVTPITNKQEEVKKIQEQAEEIRQQAPNPTTALVPPAKLISAVVATEELSPMDENPEIVGPAAAALDALNISDYSHWLREAYYSGSWKTVEDLVKESLRLRQKAIDPSKHRLILDDPVTLVTEVKPEPPPALLEPPEPASPLSKTEVQYVVTLPTMFTVLWEKMKGMTKVAPKRPVGRPKKV